MSTEFKAYSARDLFLEVAKQKELTQKAMRDLYPALNQGNLSNWWNGNADCPPAIERPVLDYLWRNTGPVPPPVSRRRRSAQFAGQTLLWFVFICALDWIVTGNVALSPADSRGHEWLRFFVLALALTATIATTFGSKKNHGRARIRANRATLHRDLASVLTTPAKKPEDALLFVALFARCTAEPGIYMYKFIGDETPEEGYFPVAICWGSAASVESAAAQIKAAANVKRPTLARKADLDYMRFYMGSLAMPALGAVVSKESENK